MFGNHGLGGLLEESAHEKSPKCLGGILGNFAKVSARYEQGLAKQHIADGSKTAQQFGVSGVPFLVEETAQGWR